MPFLRRGAVRCAPACPGLNRYSILFFLLRAETRNRSPVNLNSSQMPLTNRYLRGIIPSSKYSACSAILQSE